MATLVRKKRLFNPSRKKKRLSLKQKLFFGSKRQREAARASLKNSGRRKHRTRKRVSNIGEIFTIKLRNPSRRKRKVNSMARRKHVRRRRRNAPRPWAGIYERHYHTRKRRARRNPGVHRRRRRRNPESHRERVLAARRGWAHRRHHRRRNPSYRRVHRRRNPLGADVSRTLSIVAGAVVTKFVSSSVAKFSPSFASGYMNWALIGATAVAQGWVVKKVLKKPSLGDDMVVGGLVYLAIQVINSMFPSLSLSGLGYIGNSSFYTPQVPVNGSMGRFLVPPTTSQAISSAVASLPKSNGMGAVVALPNNGGRTSLRRGLRTA